MSLTTLDKQNIKQLVENKTPFKVKVKEEDSKEFQEFLFSLDVEWFIGGKRLSYGLPTLFCIQLRERAISGLGISYSLGEQAYNEHTTYKDHEGNTYNLTELVLCKEIDFNKVLHPDDIKQIRKYLIDKISFQVEVTKEQSEAIQQLCFDHGVYWCGLEGYRESNHLDATYLGVTDLFDKYSIGFGYSRCTYDSGPEGYVKDLVLRPVKEMRQKINLPQKAIAQIVKAIREKIPFKVRVNEEQNEAVQLLCFKYNVSWLDGRKEVLYPDNKYLFGSFGLNSYKLSRDSKNDEQFFIEEDCQEINLNEEYNLPLSAIKKIVYSVINEQPFKVKVTPEQSKEVQRIVFDLGGSWSYNKEKVVKHTEQNCLFCNKQGQLTNTHITNPADTFFTNQRNKEIKLTKQAKPIILSKKGFKRWVKQRRAFKIETRSEHESRWIQETLFNAGIGWADESREVDTSEPWLFFTNGYLTHFRNDVLDSTRKGRELIQLKTPIEVFNNTFNLPEYVRETIKDYVKNRTPFTIKVDTLFDNANVQKFLFSLGIEWASLGKIIRHIDVEGLHIGHYLPNEYTISTFRWKTEKNREISLGSFKVPCIETLVEKQPKTQPEETKEMTFNLPEETIEEIKQLVSTKTPFKIRVNEQQSEEVQKLLFSLGVYWVGETNGEVRNTKAGNLTYSYMCEGLSKWAWINIAYSQDQYDKWKAKEVFINESKVYKTPLDCLQALKEGNILYGKNINGAYNGYFKLENEVLYYTMFSDLDGWVRSNAEVNSLKNMTEYVKSVKKEWFNDLGKGRLAWVKDKEDEGYTVGLVVRYAPGRPRPFICKGADQGGYGYDEAKPMTKEEALSFLIE